MSNILVFDSGVGGISVVREIKQLLPHVTIDYVFDNLYYPYGELDETTLINRLVSLLRQLSQQIQPDLIVIACNSASTIALPSLRDAFDIPIVGVVPAIKPASRLSQSKVIGLLATQGTVTRGYIEQLKRQHASDCQLVSIGSNELVVMAEQSFRQHDIDELKLKKICQPIFEQADVMVLGCTHFPLLKETLIKLAPEHIQMVDSGKAIAARVSDLLREGEVQKIKTPNDLIDHRAFYTKDNLDKALIAALFSEGFNDIELITQPLD